MKKLLTSLCVITLALVCLLALPTRVDAIEWYTEGDYTYSITNGEASIVVYNGAGGDVSIPTTLGGYPVTGISGFGGCTSLTSITIPDSVTSIGNFAFEKCTSLTSVAIPDSVTDIGQWAFWGCTSLTLVTIGDGVTSIGGAAFKECTGLTSVTIGNRVTDIGGSAFYYCTSLTSVVIPDSVTSIDRDTFNSCTGLIEVTIGDGVGDIGYAAFENCTSLTTVTIPDGVNSIGGWGFHGCTSLTSAVIGNGVDSIGYGAFNGCTGLATVTIGNGITSIGESAFHSCTKLTTVTIGNEVTSIGREAFCGCDSLKDVYYAKTQSSWDAIDIGYYNTGLDGATIHYNHIHDYSLFPAVAVEPTCTEMGYVEYTCVYGEKHREYVSALGHQAGNSGIVTQPTCEEKGYTQYTCTRCGEAFNADWVDPLGHDHTGPRKTIEPTCTIDGATGPTCIRCGDFHQEETIPALGHKALVVQAKAPTCTEAGNETGTKCERCQEIFMTPTEIPALGHIFTNYISDHNATCTADGTETANCDRCTETHTRIEEDSKLGHSFTQYKSNNNATCTENGTETAKCDRCDVTNTRTAVNSKLGHDEITHEAKAVTCTEIGWNAYVTCSRCNYTTYAEIAATDHKHESVVTAPTCLDKGYTTHTCHCGDTYVDTYVNALGHKHTAKVTKPTCTAKGYTTYTCACGDTYKANYINALGHSYKSGVCTRCKHKPTGAKITTQPVNVAVKSGKTATVSIKATGSGLKYTWYYAKKGAKTYTKASSTTNSYSLKMSSSYNGTKAYCVVTDQYGNSVKSNMVTLYKGTPVKITTQPKSATVANGKTGKLTIKASGSSLKYSWYIQYKGASSFTKVGSSSKTYSFKMASKLDGAEVYCVVKDKYGIEVKSSVVTLKMPVQPKITTQPASVKLFSGKTAKLTVKASGDGLKYQWYYAKAGSSKFKKLSAKSATYSLKMSSSMDGRKVYCLVTDKYGQTVKSSVVTLTMLKTAKITTQPKNVSVKNGKAATVTIKATGDGLKYTWYYLLPGTTTYQKAAVTNNAFSVTMSAKYKNAKVYCSVADQYGNVVKSKTVTLKMK